MWKDWLAFSRTEQYGIIFLAILIVILTAARIVLPVLMGEPEVVFIEDVNDYLSFEEDQSMLQKGASASETPKHHYHLKPFNPNRINVTDLYGMGLSPYVIVNWMKFREAGGMFYSPEDIGRIYGIDSSLVARIKPFADFEKTRRNNNHKFTVFNQRDNNSSGSGDEKERLNNSVSHSPHKTKKAVFSSDSEELPLECIEINQAGAEEFRQLNGIGEVYSSRIIAFRDLLGGFCNIDQLTEVYGISDELFERIRKYLATPGGPIEKIDVNQASLRRLRAHPYLDFYQARDIVEYRNEKGIITDARVLTSLASFDREILERALPYLSFNTNREKK
jgi:competence protein ComEA